MPNPGRGTAQNSESRRRGATNSSSTNSSSTNRGQGKNPTTTAARGAGRSDTSTSQRQSSSGSQRGTTGTTGTAGTTRTPGTTPSKTTPSSQTQERGTQTGQAQTRQTASPSPEQPSTAQADREMPMQSTRETAEREASTGVGRRSSQETPVYGGYGVGSPFLAIRRFMEDMDRLASDFGFGGTLFSPVSFGQEPLAGMRGLLQQGGRAGTGLPTLWNPQIDVFQRGDQLVVRADLPGTKREDVTVEIDQNTLTIRGERRQELEDRSEGMYRSERSYGTFQRSIGLPEGITPDDAQATFNDGVLEITLKTPKPQQRSKTIQIR